MTMAKSRAIKTVDGFNYQFPRLMVTTFMHALISIPDLATSATTLAAFLPTVHYAAGPDQLPPDAQLLDAKF
jgi:hypothetical protein